MNDEQDREIIIRILKGDRQAYAILVDRYKGPVFDLAYRMTGNWHEAEELSQETFVTVYERLGDFNKHKRLFPWINTIALNLARNHLKKRRREAPEKLPPIHPEPTREKPRDPEQDAMLQEQVNILNQRMLRLPPDLREAVVLRCFHDLPFREVSQILNISPAAAKMRVYRGLEKLRGGLGDPDDPKGS